MRSRSRTRNARRFALGAAGASVGTNDSTGASTDSFPSATASPTAVDVKLLLSEYITCGVRASFGAHHPSATTLPWRTIMTLSIASIEESAPCTNERIAREGMPCRSGVLRGNEDADWAARRTLVKTSAAIRSGRILMTGVWRAFDLSTRIGD